MPEMTIKEWTAAYRAINEAEQKERIATLPGKSVEETVRAYFALGWMLRKFALEAEENSGLQEMRAKQYKDLFDKWERLAQRLKHAHQS